MTCRTLLVPVAMEESPMISPRKRFFIWFFIQKLTNSLWIHWFQCFNTHRIHVCCYIYGNMDPINIPQILAYYIPYMDPSWDIVFKRLPSGKQPHNHGKIHHAINGKIHYFDRAIFNSYFDITRGYVIAGMVGWITQSFQWEFQDPKMDGKTNMDGL